MIFSWRYNMDFNFKNAKEFKYIERKVKDCLSKRQVYSIGFICRTLEDITFMSIAKADFKIDDVNDDIINFVADNYLGIYTDDIID